MRTQIPQSMLERFSEDFSFFAFANESDITLIHKIEEAILICLQRSILKGTAPRRAQENNQRGSHTPGAMGSVLAAKARKAGAESAWFTLSWIRDNDHIVGATYHVYFTIPNMKSNHHWCVSQRFMFKQYKWSTPASSTLVPR
jgi:hypothetical protein